MWFSVTLLACIAVVPGLANPVSKSCTKRPAACNGDARLCNRLYSNVSQIGTHDSAFVGPLITDNQDVSVQAQLDAGIRFLQAQTHNFTNQVLLCHTSCALENSGPLLSYFQTIKTWLDSNPSQVLTLLLTNGDGVSMPTFDALMASSGLKKYVFTPSKQLAINEWPTLQQMINAGTRLVFFMDAGADVAVVPYILPEFSYFFETPFDTLDPNFAQCTLDRPAGASPIGLMYIVNHFLDKELFPGIDVPDTANDYRTNNATGPGSIGSQNDLCFQTYGRLPNFVLVDNFDRGNVFIAQNTMNHLS